MFEAILGLFIIGCISIGLCTIERNPEQNHSKGDIQALDESFACNEHKSDTGEIEREFKSKDGRVHAKVKTSTRKEHQPDGSTDTTEEFTANAEINF